MLAQAQETISVMTNELNDVRRSPYENLRPLEYELSQGISLRITKTGIKRFGTTSQRKSFIIYCRNKR